MKTRITWTTALWFTNETASALIWLRAETKPHQQQLTTDTIDYNRQHYTIGYRFTVYAPKLQAASAY